MISKLIEALADCAIPIYYQEVRQLAREAAKGGREWRNLCDRLPQVVAKGNAVTAFRLVAEYRSSLAAIDYPFTPALDKMLDTQIGLGVLG